MASDPRAVVLVTRTHGQRFAPSFYREYRIAGCSICRYSCAVEKAAAPDARVVCFDCAERIGVDGLFGGGDGR